MRAETIASALSGGSQSWECATIRGQTARPAPSLERKAHSIQKAVYLGQAEHPPGIRFLVVAFAFASFISSSAGVAASFRGIGGFSEPIWSQAHAVSADGSVVVGQSQTGLTSAAFRWTASGGMECLGSPGEWSIAIGVSGDGSVVVGAFSSTSYPWIHEACRWTTSGEMEALGFLPGLDRSAAWRASYDGSVVVGECVSNGDGEGFYWTPALGMRPLVRAEDWRGVGPRGVSADGSVIVGEGVRGTVDEGVQEAFLWTASGGFKGLGGLPDSDRFGSGAFAVSADGEVIVGWAYSGPHIEAFRWTSSTGMEGLGFLPGETVSMAHGVSADGSVVVGDHFIWDEVNGMRDLKEVLENDYGLDLTGWWALEAFSISADGSTIVGAGLNPDLEWEAWVAVLTDIVPNRPPDCSGAYADPMILWPPNHKMVPVEILGVTDPDGDPVTITIVGITSDEPTASDKGSGGAKHAPDATWVQTSVASLRAECSGTGNGRVYQISFYATDAKGGICGTKIQVGVPHDQGAGSVPVDDGQKYDATKVN